jgi:hypothetical protein
MYPRVTSNTRLGFRKVDVIKKQRNDGILNDNATMVIIQVI